MAIFAIGDLHLSLGSDKPMDIFKGWQDYVSRLTENWNKLVAADDTVVLVGDTSWAMKLSDCKTDFAFLEFQLLFCIQSYRNILIDNFGGIGLSIYKKV